ncbi:MFS transporter [Paenibacillus sediminis]|uniref:MFS family permease n=1 Tax=Paenibacillus sediminis TaxID=664909 RepID=A0ABS4H2W7_9BACL|nr:MFS transporter [Paenibacillus sediminis]MBP1936879.1 MFS family permease [Paenibacillus sediminis]
MPSTIFGVLLGQPFLTGYLLYLGATSGQIGFVLAITTFVNVLQIGIAYWMQKLKRRKWMLVLFVALHRILWSSTGLIPFIFSKEYWVSAFIVMYTAAFIANTAGSVLWTSVISDIVPARVRGRYFGIRNTILNALGSIAMFAGGTVLDRVPGGEGFLVLYFMIWTCALLNILIFLFYPEVPFERSTESKFLPMFTRPLRDKSFIRAAFFLAMWLLVQTLVVPMYSYVMLNLLKINYQTVSGLTVLQTVMMMISFYIWGNLNAKYSNKKLLYWTLPIIAVSCLSWGLLSIFPTLLVLIIVHTLLGVGVGGFNQLSFNFVIGDTPKTERAMFFAVYSAVTGFASFIGPMIGGKVYEWITDLPLWMQIYGLQASAGVIMLVMAFTLGRRVLSD